MCNNLAWVDRKEQTSGTTKPVLKPSSTQQAAILFTAFEPSGDAHAAPVIKELIERAPGLRVYAWGGPKMEAAGATIVEQTSRDGAMGLNSLSKVLYVRKQIGAIKRWAEQYRVLAHVPVDSPAANFPICKVMHKRGARVIHLVAPQIWAWGRWRIRKLRRLTDLVLCLLPFEEQWFNDRNVPARFIGHPIINRELNIQQLKEYSRGLPQGTPRIAIFPGSRSSEVRANIRLLCDAFTELQSRHASMSGVIVAANPELAKIVRSKVRVFPTGLHLTTGQADEVIHWCEMALAVSGTISLDIARQQKPMIGVYKTGVISWLGAKVLLRTPYRLLPNIIADREVSPEFIPHIGGCTGIVREATHLLHDSKNAAIQSEGMRRVVLRFANKKPAEEAAVLIIQTIKAASPKSS